jgi:hypothetical protein
MYYFAVYVWALIYTGGTDRGEAVPPVEWGMRCKLERIWIFLQLGRILRESWMAWCWGRSGGGPWTYATFALQPEELSAKVDSTEIVRPNNFTPRQHSMQNTQHFTSQQTFPHCNHHFISHVSLFTNFTLIINTFSTPPNILHINHQLHL